MFAVSTIPRVLPGTQVVDFVRDLITDLGAGVGVVAGGYVAFLIVASLYGRSTGIGFVVRKFGELNAAANAREEAARELKRNRRKQLRRFSRNFKKYGGE